MEETTAPKRKRGRPRPLENIARDDLIETTLKARGPMTRNALSETLGLSRSLTYLALVRLREQNRVRQCLQDKNKILWSTEVETPCP